MMSTATSSAIERTPAQTLKENDNNWKGWTMVALVTGVLVVVVTVFSTFKYAWLSFYQKKDPRGGLKSHRVKFIALGQYDDTVLSVSR